MYIDLWFYCPYEDDRQHWLNQLVSAVDPPFSHCEIQLPSGDAYAVYAGTAVLKRRRDFDQRFYTPLRLPCSPEQLSSVADFCENMHQNKVQFHHMCLLSTITSQVTGPLINSQRFTCCSRMTAAALHAADIMHIQNPDMTPSQLFRLLSPLASSRCSSLSPIDFR